MTYSFNGQQGLVLVDARLVGPMGHVGLRLALDIGSIRTLISEKVLQAAGYHPKTSAQSVQITTASGALVVPQVTIAAIEALGRQRQLLPVAAHTLPPSTLVDGVLGLDFLRGHVLTIDFPQGTILLQ